MADRRGLTRAGALLGEQVAARGGNDLVARLQLEQAWPELVGTPLSRFTRPERVVDGTLIIAVANPTWHGTLQTMLPRLQQAAAERCPELGIRAVRVVLGEPPAQRPARPAPEPTPTARAIDAVPVATVHARQIEATAARLDDPELRQRLAALMRRELQVRQWRLGNGWRADPETGELHPPREPA